MYAVIETGGKQYRVEVGTELEVELLEGEAGDSVKLERILLVADGETAAIGRPVVANASVAAEVVRRDRGEKTISFKYRPKARRRVKKGHRQELTILRISDIILDGKSAADEKAEADKARQAEREKLEATARRQAAADAALAARLAADKPEKAETAAGKKAAPTKRGAAREDAQKSEPAKAAEKPARGAKAAATTTRSSKGTATPAAKAATKSTPKTPAKPASKAVPNRATTKKDS
jgi:large subunit ribosomal protein L21